MTWKSYRLFFMNNLQIPRHCELSNNDIKVFERPKFYLFNARPRLKYIDERRINFFGPFQIFRFFLIQLCIVLKCLWIFSNFDFSNKRKHKFRRFTRDNFLSLSRILYIFTFLSLSFPKAADGIRRAKGSPPRVIDSESATLNAFAGQTLTLPCVVSGYPAPETSWYKDGDQVGLDWGRFKEKRASLRIRNVKVADSGLYTCQAVNGFGMSETKIRLIVHDQSTINRERKKTTVKPIFSQPVKMRRNLYIKPQGGTVNFRCRAKGKPRPRIRWYKDGNLTELPPSSRSSKPQWTLTLKDIRVKDSGKYKCRVWNSAGEISFEYVLRVVGSSSHELPVILPPNPVNTTVRRGEKSSLLCSVRSMEAPTIKWIKKLDQANVDSFKGKWPNNSLKIDEKLYLILPPQQMMRVADGSYLSKLILSNVKDKDSGMYICLGANTMGYSFRYAYLTVISDGRFDTTITKTQSSLPLGVVVGLPSGVGLLLIILIGLKCFWNQSTCPKQLPSAHVQQTSYSGTCIRTVNSQEITVQSEVERFCGGNSARLMHSSENYVNPTHTASCCGSESSGKSKQFSAKNTCGDATETDASIPPPPPPPSQYSHSSSHETSSAYSGRFKRCGHRSRSHHHHHHHHRHVRSPSPKCSNVYDDF